ncbi:50S ribosomal protein L11 methyltransferase [Candidatus Woesearchaeota archaeon]|nr:50S ribosomal protein L11 methyltransferase [Candidatus Woesearchaeota archaeon]
MIMNKKKLALILSQVQIFKKPNVQLEQYSTPSEIAADALWKVFMDGNIEGKVLCDPGCGTGIFGLGALILGAKKVYFIDIDSEALKIAKKNKSLIEKMLNTEFKTIFLNQNISSFNKKVDVVIENPPFGVQKSHTDKLFLIKAMESAPIIYSFHKLSTQKFVEIFCKENGFTITKIGEYSFPLKKTFWFHTKKVDYAEVGLWKIQKIAHHKV